MTLRPRFARVLTPRLLVLLVAGLATAPRAATCTVMAPAFTFPNYNALAAQPNSGFSRLGINCVTAMGQTMENVSYTVRLSTGSSGSYTARTFLGQPMEYNLYVDANHTQVWGDGTNGTSVVQNTLGVTGNASASHSIYGLIPARQSVEPGTVSDRVVVTVDY